MSPAARGPRRRSAAFACDGCGRALRVPVDRVLNEVACPGCGRRHPLRVDGPMLESGLLTQCLVCGLDRFYTQKDFNKKLGIGLFAAAALLSVPTWGLSLLGATILDYGLSKTLGDVTICYRCLVQYRGFRPGPGHGPFDLHVAEAIDNEPHTV